MSQLLLVHHAIVPDIALARLAGLRPVQIVIPTLVRHGDDGVVGTAKHRPVVLWAPNLPGNLRSEAHNINRLARVAIAMPLRDLIDDLQDRLRERLLQTPLLAAELLPEDPCLEAQLVRGRIKGVVEEVVLEDDDLIFIAGNRNVVTFLTVKCQGAPAPAHEVHHAELAASRERQEITDLSAVHHLDEVVLESLEQGSLLLVAALHGHQNVALLGAAET
mmetsp:Transcript_49981/g.107130  ORF Transcript_49981/g.107130 Transcript_49981/m.107130 type:complete len:219 (+) Transcript_49981:2577-3233(+)